MFVGIDVIGFICLLWFRAVTSRRCAEQRLNSHELTPLPRRFIALVIVAVVGVVFYFRRHGIRASLNAADRPSTSWPGDPPDGLPEDPDPAGKGGAAAKPGRMH